MPLKTPKFWYPENHNASSLIAKLLTPISVLYQGVHKVLQSGKEPKRVSVPVICVGNLTAGGSGKTPTCIALAELLRKRDPKLEVAFLTRGYCSKETRPKVIQGHEPADEVGDEPLILKKHAKTIISAERHIGACTAIEQGAECVIMDDGLFNQSLHKDLSFLVFNGLTGIGNGKTIPAGPLREPFEQGIQHASAVIFIGQDKYNLKKKIPKNIPVFSARISADTTSLDHSAKYMAFSGIALPQKFKQTLQENNIKVTKFIEFADHHNFTKTDIEKIKADAQKHDAKIVTTEKDFVRLNAKQKENITYLPIKLEFEEPEKVVQVINTVLK